MYVLYISTSDASDILHVLMGVSVAYQSCLIMRNVTIFICRINVILLLLTALRNHLPAVDTSDVADGSPRT